MGHGRPVAAHTPWPAQGRPLAQPLPRPLPPRPLPPRPWCRRCPCHPCPRSRRCPPGRPALAHGDTGTRNYFLPRESSIKVSRSSQWGVLYSDAKEQVRRLNRLISVKAIKATSTKASTKATIAWGVAYGRPGPVAAPPPSPPPLLGSLVGCLLACLPPPSPPPSITARPIATTLNAGQPFKPSSSSPPRERLFCWGRQSSCRGVELRRRLDRRLDHQLFPLLGRRLSLFRMPLPRQMLCGGLLCRRHGRRTPQQGLITGHRRAMWPRSVDVPSSRTW